MPAQSLRRGFQRNPTFVVSWVVPRSSRNAKQLARFPTVPLKEFAHGELAQVRSRALGLRRIDALNL